MNTELKNKVKDVVYAHTQYSFDGTRDVPDGLNINGTIDGLTKVLSDELGRDRRPLRVYYARPISLYGTKQDERDLLFLESMGFEVNNPNKAELVERYKTEGMEVYFQLVRDSDALAFRAFPDGKLGAGVYKEILVAQEAGKLVIELPTITSARVLSVEDTREYLRLLGTR